MHGELIAGGKAEKLTFRQIQKLERIDLRKQRETQAFELAKGALTAAGETMGGLFRNQIAGTITLALLLAGAYGWGPTRALMENVAQGIAFGAAQGWKNTIEPALKDFPPISVFFPADTMKGPPPRPGENQPPVCVSQWTYLKYSPLAGWTRGWFDTAEAAIAQWTVDNTFDLAGNLVAVTRCTASDGTVNTTYQVIKYAPGHSDIDNPANSFFRIP